MSKILVVDDQPTARDFLVTLLGYAGHDVLEASDGGEALSLARDEHPDLIITDILMPTMDGYEFVRQLRNEPGIAGTSVVFYSATYHDREAAALAQKCGVTHLLRKPSEPEIVIKAIQTALGLEVPASMKAAADDFDREHLRIMTDKLSEKVSELEIAKSRLEALIELSQHSASIHDIRRLTDTFCNATRSLLGAKYAGILLLDPRGDEVEYFCLSGATLQLRSQVETPPLKGVLKELSLSLTPMTERDFGGAWRSRFSANHPLVYSFLGVPIRSRERCHAVIYAANKIGADGFAEDEKPLLVTVAARYAVYCENVRLYEQLEERAGLLKEQTQRLKSLSTRLMQAREDEQRHIARELHDEVGQGLTALKLHLEAAQKDLTGVPGVNHVEECLQITERTLQQIRSLSLDLRPSVLDDLGLIPALRWLIARQAPVAGFKVNLTANPATPDLPVDVRTSCFRVVQESLTNIVRHASATHVSVELVQDESGLRLRISDNGRGFVVPEARARASAGGSLGLVGMEERASLAGGLLKIDSVPGRGTTIQLEFPECRRQTA